MPEHQDAHDEAAWADQLARAVADKERAQEELRLSREKYETAFRTSPDSININTLAEGRYIEVNDGFCELTGYTRDDVIGRTSEEISIWSDLSDRQRLVEQLRASGVASLEADFRVKDGSLVTGLMSARVMTVDGVGCILSIVRDISARKAAEREVAALNEELEARVQQRTAELREALERLEAATRVKDRFLASMSHELRTPLNSIIGFSGVLLQGLAGELHGEQRAQLMMINSAGKHLLGLVNDVLDLERLEAGFVHPKVSDVDAGPIAHRVATQFQTQCEDKGLRLITRVPRGPVAVRADKRFIEQILWNLLGNAVKFTTEGSVTLTVRVLDGGACAFVVSDTGPGIEGELAERVFEEFVQVDWEDEGKPGGTGLGLAISRRLAELMGGRLTLESTVGEGSSFTLTLPCATGNGGPGGGPAGGARD